MSDNNSAIARITKPAADIFRILSPNPSPMTYTGTNTYIVDDGEIAVIDPGPKIQEHYDNILEVIGEKPVKYIFLTHSHIDHSPLAADLSIKYNTPVYGYGPSDAGLSKTMLKLISDGYQSGSEGIDHNFNPDYLIKDGEYFELNETSIIAIHTPGHMGNHVCFQCDEVLFSGDHIMGWATSMVSPPYGDLTQFMNSCRLLEDINISLILPGHGEPVDDPKERIKYLIRHRLEREQQIKSTLQHNPLNALEITELVYIDVDKSLIPAATRNVFAHLLDLNERGFVVFEGIISETMKVRLIKN